MAIGFVIHELEKSAPNFEVLLDSLAELDLKHLSLSIADGIRPLPNASFCDYARVQQWIARLQEQSMTVWGWAHVYADVDVSTQLYLIWQQMQALQLTHLVIHPIHETGTRWSVSAARRFVSAFNARMPDAMTVALCVSPQAKDFPLADFLVKNCRALMPKLILTSSAGGVGVNLRSARVAYMTSFPDKTILPVAMLSGTEHPANQQPYHWVARADQIHEVLDTATELQLDAQFALLEDTHRYPALWDAIAKWQYLVSSSTAAPSVTPPALTTTTTPTVTTETAPQTTSSVPSPALTGTPEEQLLQYGVVLGVEAGAQWAANETNIVLDVVKAIGDSLAPLFQDMFGMGDGLLAFRMLYAPQLIQRHQGVNVNPNAGGGVWYGYNSNGFVLHFGDKMFLQGEDASRAGQGLKFNAPQIVCHEFSHTINWRYSQIATLPVRELDAYYHDKLRIGQHKLPSGETVSLATANDGYLFAARSSNDNFETVTDAIANFTYHGIASDKKGDARLQQLSQLLAHIIQHRVQNYGGVAALQTNLRANAAVRRYADSLTRAFDGLTTLDTQLATLKQKLAAR
jgi:hypothetical protein